MPDIEDGQIVEIKGSGREPYILKNVGGVYSCSCPAWRNQSMGIEKRTCKHIRQYRGEEAEAERLGGEIPPRAVKTKTAKVTAEDGSVTEVSTSTEPAILLAHPWKNDTDLAGWWMSEKLDGVRAYWNGEQFISRQGNVFLAPDWFIDDLPSDIPLDGELWLARKQFQRTVSIVRRQDKNDLWKEIRYVVFDAPDVDDVFEARMAFVQEYLDERQPRYAQPHLHVRCRGTDHLREELARVEALGGEGLMLRKPGSRYERCRSFTLLKVKTFHDADARVIEHLPGTGKHTGRLGALAVELANGTRFSVGTGFTDAERNNPPQIGSIITFSYQELSDRGVPRFPSFVRLRTDVDQLSDNVPSTPNEVQVGSGTTATASQTAQVSNASKLTTATASSTPPPTAASAAKPAQPATKPSAAKAVAKAPVSPASGPCLLGPRYFEFVEGTSSKFWEIKVIDTQVIVRFGRIGTDGMIKPKSFPTTDAALKYAEEIIEEKVDKGYEEIESEAEETEKEEELAEDSDEDDEDESEDEDGGQAPPPVKSSPTLVTNQVKSQSVQSVEATPVKTTMMPSPTVETKVAVAASQSPAPQKTAPAKTAPTQKVASQTCTLGPRYFEFVEGTASKFWEIKVVGNEVIVRFGRIGTDGQMKPKAFPSETAALKYAEEIIAEKTEKGYEEIEQEQEEEEEEEEADNEHENDGEANSLPAITSSENSDGSEDASGDDANGDEDDLDLEEEEEEVQQQQTIATPTLRVLPSKTDTTQPAGSQSPAQRQSPPLTPAVLAPQLKPAKEAVEFLLGPKLFEFTEDDSSKFWEISVEGKIATVRFGRIGTDGQIKPKTFSSDEIAIAYAEEMIDEKIDQGYVEKVPQSKPISTAKVVQEPYPQPPTAEPAGKSPTVVSRLSIPPRADSKQSPSTEPQKSDPGTPAQAGDSGEKCTLGPRYFQFEEGASSKFWEVKVVGNQVIVRFGKISTAGQTKPKPFPSDSAALTYAQKLIEEKLEKGYEEIEQDTDSDDGDGNETVSAPDKTNVATIAQMKPKPSVASVPQPVEVKPAPTARTAVMSLVTTKPAVDDNDSDDDEVEEGDEADNGVDPNAITFGPKYLELTSTEPAKFWEIKVIGKNVFVRAGSMGSVAHWQRKPFPSETAALSYAGAMMTAKDRQGFEEVDRS